MKQVNYRKANLKSVIKKLKKKRLLSNKMLKILFLIIVGSLLLGVIGSPVFAQEQVGLYDMWEIKVINSKSYSNPFDFNVIELQATFTSPSGKKVDFFGFYDGDGNGGQTGNVWKLRFMPDEVGNWTYTYTWTDGTPGGSGSFDVVDIGLQGPLKVASDNSWYFETARGDEFDFRGYGMHHWRWCGNFPSTYCWKSIISEKQNFIDDIQSYAIDEGYNVIMINGSSRRLGEEGDPESWWINDSEAGKKIFNVETWDAWDDVLDYCKDNGLYAFSFSGMFQRSSSEYGFEDTKTFYKYWVARFAPYYNFFGWSPNWDWNIAWTEAEINERREYIDSINPFPTLLTAHDSAYYSNRNWMDFVMRQKQTTNINDGNCRDCWRRTGAYIDSYYRNKPIIGSEDIWETEGGRYGNPTNPAEVRRGAWGMMMAGIMPLYSEWTLLAEHIGNMPGEAEVKRMFEFWYDNPRVNYRNSNFNMHNNLVSGTDKICSGVLGQEYLVYDHDGGSITIDLSGTSSTDTFTVLWYDPKNGMEQDGGNINGGISMTLTSPFSGDSVLLLGGVDTTFPGDFSGDGCVDIADLAMFVEFWLQCNDPQNPDCEFPF